MKCLLFFPRIEKSFRASYAPLGLLSIASYLNANGHTAVICDRFFENDSLSDVIKKHKPDMIGVSILSHTFLDDAILISAEAHKNNIPVVWGGTLGSVIDEAALESGLVDYVSRFEGEETWLEMADAYDKRAAFDKIEGLSFMKDGNIVRTPDRPFTDLSKLPDLDWTLVNVKNYLQKSFGYDRLINTYMSKGCHGKCAYCYNPNYNKSNRRSRSVEQVIREMRFLKENYDADGFDFTDDVMFADRNEAVSFCDKMIESGLDVCWSGYLSFGVLNTQEDYDYLYKAGCRSMIMGIESGSERVLKSVFKPNRLDKIRSNIEMMVNAGIVPVAMFMIGFPGEAEEDLRKTVSLAKELNGISHYCAYFTPLPGSRLYADLIAQGRIEPKITLEEYARVNEMEKLVDNYTLVPDIELAAIKKFFRLRGLILKTPGEKSEQFSRIILTTVKSWCGRGIVHFVKISTMTVMNVLRTLTIFLHPKIRKKYGLYFTK